MWEPQYIDFLHGGHFLSIKNPATGLVTGFHNAGNVDGFLHEGGPTGPPLRRLRSRGNIGREVTLNPILVNLLAHVRMRRLDRGMPGWRAALHQDAKDILTEIGNLHEAVIWTPPELEIFDCVEIKQ